MTPIKIFAAITAISTVAAAADWTTPKPLDTSLPPPPSVLVKPSGPPEVLAGGYLKIGFDRLSTFELVTSDTEALSDPQVKRAATEKQIPEDIKALDGKKVMLTGFMLPLKLEKGLVTEFLLMKDQMTCCYGATPGLNEWVSVKIKDGVKLLQDVPISFYGKLKVAVTADSFGIMTGVYSLEAEKMAPLK